MNMRLKKALSDLRVNPGRAALVVFALVIGLWGVGSLMVSTVILRNDLKENFTRTAPPHAVLTSKDFERLDLAVLRNRPEIAEAEFRDLSLQRIEVHPNEWVPLWLFGVTDFGHLRLARFYNEQGRSVPDPGAMLVERDGLLISDLREGSRARVRAANRVIEIPISGISFDPGQAPATQDHKIYAYVDKATYLKITGEQPDRRLIIRFKSAGTRLGVQAAVNRLVQELKPLGVTVTTATVPRLDEHPHQWQLNTLLLLQGSIALLAFLMAAVMVSQLMAAILSRQVRQIGILKAIGASTVQVLQIYLFMVLVLGAAAGIIALPMAIGSGSAFAHFVASQLNFNIITTRLPSSLYLMLAAAGLVLPMVFSLPALVRGVRVPVHQAISDYGIRQEAPTRRILASGAWPWPAFLVLAFRNTLRRRRRLIVTVAAMGLGAAIFATGFNIRESLASLLSEVKQGMRYDVQVVLRRPTIKSRALTPFRSIDNLKRVETWNGGKGELQSRIVSSEDGVGIVALPFNSDLVGLRIEKGRWLRGSGEPEVVLNQQAVEDYRHPKVGDRVPLILGGRKVAVTLVGVVWELDRAKIYMDQELYDAYANPGHEINSLMFVAKENSYERVVALKQDIERALASSELDVLYVMSRAERVKVVYDHLNIILTTIVFLALTVLVVSALGMASATSIGILERTREIGVLRAIGATPEMIYRLLVAEGMIVSMAGIFLGLVLSWPLGAVAAPFFGDLMLGRGALLRLVFSPAGFWITAAATLVFGWLASRLPARSALRVTIREALAYE